MAGKAEKQQTGKAKNELRIFYDNAKMHYKGITTQWKTLMLTSAEYQSFMRFYSYTPSEDVPKKFHDKVEKLKSMIDAQKQLVKTFTQTPSKV